MNRRQEILRRAAEVFQNKGVMGSSMEDIAHAVGIKREGLYYYFKNRSDILLEITLPQSIAMTRTLRRICNSGMGPEEKLQTAVASHLDNYNPNYLEMSVALREHHFVQEDDKFAELKQVWNEYGQLWVDLITQGQAAGVFDSRLDPKIGSFGILGMLNWVSRWYQPDGEVSIDDIAATFNLLAATGLHGGAGPASHNGAE
jgi:AcrR family transcriptional regulator